MSDSKSRPTDDTIALAAVLQARPWMSADEIRHAVAKFGFDHPSSQWIVGRLTRMCREECPRFQRRDSRYWGYEYRVTGWAATGLGNLWDGFKDGLVRPNPKPEERV